MCVYVCVCIRVYVSVCVCVCALERDRERERETERERGNSILPARLDDNDDRPMHLSQILYTFKICACCQKKILKGLGMCVVIFWTFQIFDLSYLIPIADPSILSINIFIGSPNILFPPSYLKHFMGGPTCPKSSRWIIDGWMRY